MSPAGCLHEDDCDCGSKPNSLHSRASAAGTIATLERERDTARTALQEARKLLQIFADGNGGHLGYSDSETCSCVRCKAKRFLVATRISELTGETAETPAPTCGCDKHETACAKRADYLVTRAGKRIAVCDRCTLPGDADDRDLNPDWSKWPSPELTGEKP